MVIRLLVQLEKEKKIDIVTNGSYLDVYVRTNKRNTGGICSNGFNAAAAIHPNKVLCRHRRTHRAWCRGHGGKGHKGFMTNCVFDLCQGLRREEELKIRHEVNFEHRRRVHIDLKWWNKRHHHHHLKFHHHRRHHHHHHRRHHHHHLGEHHHHREHLGEHHHHHLREHHEEHREHHEHREHREEHREHREEHREHHEFRAPIWKTPFEPRNIFRPQPAVVFPTSPQAPRTWNPPSPPVSTSRRR